MAVSVRVVVVLTVVACLGTLVTGAADARRTKSQRPTRGFKNVEMMTARGFGKRDRPHRPEPYWKEDYTQHRRRYNPKTTLMVAPDFGKRSTEDNDGGEEELVRVTRGFKPGHNILVARAYGKRDGVYGVDNNLWEILESAPGTEGFGKNNEKTFDSISTEWFVNEIVTNPDFARSVVRKFVDINQDGILSTDELIRNVV